MKSETKLNALEEFFAFVGRETLLKRIRIDRRVINPDNNIWITIYDEEGTTQEALDKIMQYTGGELSSNASTLAYTTDEPQYYIRAPGSSSTVVTRAIAALLPPRSSDPKYPNGAVFKELRD